MPKKPKKPTKPSKPSKEKPVEKKEKVSKEAAPEHLPTTPLTPSKKGIVIASRSVLDENDLGLRGIITENGIISFEGSHRFNSNDKITIARNGDLIEVTLETEEPTHPTGTFTQTP